MIRYYLTLRLKQFWRFFTFNDFNPVIGILLITVVFVIASSAIFIKLPHAEWVYPVLALLSIVQLQAGKSNSFLKEKVARGTFLKIKLAENSVIAAPFIIELLLHKAYIPALSLGLIILPYSYSSFSISRPRLKSLPSPFLPYSFEFNAGFRTYYVVYILYALLLVAGIISHNYYVYMVPFFIMLFFQSSFYGYVEAPYYIWLNRKTPAGFLLAKLKALSVNYVFTVIPFIALGLVFYHQHWVIILFASFMGLIALAGSMLIKYQFYPAELFIQISQMVFLGITVVSLLNPIFLLLVLLVLGYSYIKAIQKLKPLLC